MACRSTWGLISRINLSASPSPSLQLSTRSFRLLHSSSSCHRATVLTSLSNSFHHTPRAPASFSRYGSAFNPTWQRISSAGRKNVISLQCCRFSTDKKDTQESLSSSSSGASKKDQDLDTTKGKGTKKGLLHENIYTVPNFLTFTRLVSAPVIGYWVLQGDYTNACILFGIASITDGLDGWIARRFNMQTIIGTILDPMADKTLMTILTVTLAMQDLIPIPIAAVILGRDAGLILASFYYRYISLPEPKTFTRYWDFSIPSAEVRPTMISKVNTAIQMGYICLSLMAPVFEFTGHVGLEYLGYTCAATTIWSGASYIYTKDAVRILHPPKKL
ncbi:hypothetical protein EC957_004323 [Mortierella hygrophila]|uniref:Cardiolipin synthase n=1 Tax=Mortierella hygrophila TaxID=979708 RepID=A0A9P6K0D5_9FUNG|nr:hypothetical protein EC957_004323 [Mortierella hygrophila]